MLGGLPSIIDEQTSIDLEAIINCTTYKDINFLSVNCNNIGMMLSEVNVMVIVGAGGGTVAVNPGQ